MHPGTGAPRIVVPASAGRRKRALLNGHAALATLILIVLLAGYLRVGVVLRSEFDGPIRADALDYVSYAFNVREHSVYSRQRTFATGVAPVPDAMRNPGYAFFLVPFLGAYPDEMMMIRVGLTQALLSTLTVILVYLIAANFISQWNALLPALLVALDARLIGFVPLLLSETLFTFLLALAAWFLARAVRSARAHWIAAAMVAVAISILVRPTLLYFPPLAACAVLGWPGFKRKRQVAAIIIAVWLAFLVPWWARNAVTLGHVSDPTLAITTIHHGSYPNFRFQDNPDSQDYPYRFDPRSDEATKSMSAVIEHVFRRAAENPAPLLAWYTIGKPVSLFGWRLGQSDDGVFQYPAMHSPFDTDPLFSISYTTSRALHGFLVVAGWSALAFAWLLRDRRPANSTLGWTRVMSLAMAFVVLVHVAGAPFGRYSVPFMPLLSIAAVLGLVGAIRWAFPGRITVRDAGA